MNTLRWWAFLAILLLNAGPLAIAQPAGETVWVPMMDPSWLGERVIRLETTLYKPEGAGPFPVMIFNHASSGGPIPASYTEKARALADYATSKGMALVVPMRRGRGQSEGANKEEPSACTVESAKHGLQYASEALDAVYSFLRQQTWASMDKVVLAGHSRGAILASVYAAQHPGSTNGVVNFSGGWKSDNCGPVDVNAALFSEAGAGAGTEVPNLFLYARSDGFYSDESMKSYGDVFKAAGGNVVFELFEVEKINGHQLFHRAMPQWRNSVDRFLENLHLTKPAYEQSAQ